jgi:Leucine-rich repeat (LRR) protein
MNTDKYRSKVPARRRFAANNPKTESYLVSTTWLTCAGNQGSEWPCKGGTIRS